MDSFHPIEALSERHYLNATAKKKDLLNRCVVRCSPFRDDDDAEDDESMQNKAVFFIAIDTWERFVNEDDVKVHYFLTHAHVDHYKGMRPRMKEKTSRFTSDEKRKRKIYTTKETKALMEERMKDFFEGGDGTNRFEFVALEYDSKVAIKADNNDDDRGGEGESFTVTAIDAGHCKGSAMFLFEGKFGKFLHTGDFRREDLCNADLTKTPLPPYLDRNLTAPIDVLYLDNTFNHTAYDHPPREKALEQIVKLVSEFEPERPIILGIDSLGKEEVIIALAEATKSKVHLHEQRYREWVLLGYPEKYVCQSFVSEPKESIRVRCVMKNATSMHRLASLSVGLKNHERWGPLVIKTSGFSFLSDQMREADEKRDNDENKNEGQEKKMEPVIRTVPYSLHSSYFELETFVKRLQPRKLVGNTRDETPEEAARKGYQSVRSVDAKRLEPFLLREGRALKRDVNKTLSNIKVLTPDNQKKRKLSNSVLKDGNARVPMKSVQQSNKSNIYAYSELQNWNDEVHSWWKSYLNGILTVAPPWEQNCSQELVEEVTKTEDKYGAREKETKRKIRSYVPTFMRFINMFGT